MTPAARLSIERCATLEDGVMRLCVLALFVSLGCGEEKGQETGCTDTSHCIDSQTRMQTPMRMPTPTPMPMRMRTRMPTPTADDTGASVLWSR